MEVISLNECISFRVKLLRSCNSIEAYCQIKFRRASQLFTDGGVAQAFLERLLIKLRIHRLQWTEGNYPYYLFQGRPMNLFFLENNQKKKRFLDQIILNEQ